MFGRRKHWEDQFDEAYSDRPQQLVEEKHRWWLHALILTAIWVAAISTVGWIAGRPMAEKTLKLLATPVGMIWLILFLQVYVAAVLRLPGWFLCGLMMFLLLTSAGNYFVRDRLSRTLEAPFMNTNVFEDAPFDCLVVLGGGSDNKPNGHPQLLSAGERIVLAAELYHAGQAKLIVATGTATESADANDQHPCEETKQILSELGVPDDHVVMLNGINTSSEIASVKKWQKGLGDIGPQRIGLCTSAWHLPRALQLCESEGLQVSPVPADFLTKPFRPDPSMVVPSAGNLEHVSIILHEYLGRLIYR